jgi:hypothetical protein
MNRRSDPKGVHGMVSSEKQQRDDENRQCGVEASLMAECRCGRIVIDGDCKRHTILCYKWRTTRPGMPELRDHTFEPVAEKPISTTAKRTISSTDSIVFISVVVRGCVRPSTNRVVVMRP